MNDKFFVPFETAKQLKEKGYADDYCDMWYNTDGELDCTAWGKVTQVLAPTYHEVIDWLEGKGILVLAMGVSRRMWYASVEEWDNEKGCDTDDYPTREEALNVAILKALEML